MTAIALVQRVQNLPPVSEAALKLISLLDKPNVDNHEIVRVLKYDNVLTAKLLQACNAPAFGLEASVSSVDQAALMLGHEQILHIVMTLAFNSVMTGSSLTYTVEMNELWKHSLVSAIAAEFVMKQTPELDGYEGAAFTASLLHDIGKLVMAQTLRPDELMEIRDRIERKQISSTDAEREVLGLDHGDVGAALLQSWRLPENIVEGVANHHRPLMQPDSPLSALVHIANSVAHHAKSTLGQTIHDLRIADDVTDAFIIDGNRMDDMVAAVRQSFDRVDDFMTMA